ncbi:hypothetical protein BSKO_13248 [Bryopsis sp. KO-2023]|nr:hypothetical protein BSKO_13248 [Bryopsis sp. KO-2023]
MPSPWKLGSSFVQMVGTISRRMKPRRSLDDELSDEPTPKRPRASSSYRIISQGEEGTETDDPQGSEPIGGDDQSNRGWSFSGCDSGAIESTSNDDTQPHIAKKPRMSGGMVESGSRKRRRGKHCEKTGKKAGQQESKQGDDDGLSEPEEEYPVSATPQEWKASRTHPNSVFAHRINIDEFGEKLIQDVRWEPGFFMYPLTTAEDILEPEMLACRKDSGAVGYRVPPTMFSPKENLTLNSKLHKDCTMTEDGERFGKGKKRSFGEACGHTTQSDIATTTNINASRDNFTVAG